MFHIVEQRKWYFLLSTLIIIPGLIALVYSLATTGLPFKMAIDFTGGAVWELSFDQPIQPSELRAVFSSAGYPDVAVTTLGDAKTAQVRLKPIDEEARLKLLAAIKDKFGQVTEIQFSSVGPTIGKEVTKAAVLAVLAASLVILGFLVVAFRKSPHPVRYGTAAIIAMIHDLLVTVGVFSILSLLFGWEADALVLTAILTIIGFSVQDTVVVFDRIRENLPKHRGEPFDRIVNRSLLETLHRSVAIHLTALYVMTALLIFGGATIREFIAVLLIGVTTGTYSSIFNASQILVGWEDHDLLGLKVAPVKTTQASPAT